MDASFIFISLQRHFPGDNMIVTSGLVSHRVVSFHMGDILGTPEHSRQSRLPVWGLTLVFACDGFPRIIVTQALQQRQGWESHKILGVSC